MFVVMLVVVMVVLILLNIFLDVGATTDVSQCQQQDGDKAAAKRSHTRERLHCC
jgi:uncharacterized membrane protein